MCGLLLCVLAQALLFPTEGGLILASPLKTFGSDVSGVMLFAFLRDRSVEFVRLLMVYVVNGNALASPCHALRERCVSFIQLTPAYDYGSYKLSDYKINSPGAVASFFYVNKISDSMTPRLFQAFYRSNFTLSRPWLTRTLSHMSLIPPGGLATDEAQVRVVVWLSGCLVVSRVHDVMPFDWSLGRGYIVAPGDAYACHSRAHFCPFVSHLCMNFPVSISSLHTHVHTYTRTHTFFRSASASGWQPPVLKWRSGSSLRRRRSKRNAKREMQLKQLPRRTQSLRRRRSRSGSGRRPGDGMLETSCWRLWGMRARREYDAHIV